MSRRIIGAQFYRIALLREPEHKVQLFRSQLLPHLKRLRGTHERVRRRWTGCPGVSSSKIQSSVAVLKMNCHKRSLCPNALNRPQFSGHPLCCLWA